MIRFFSFLLLVSCSGEPQAPPAEEAARLATNPASYPAYAEPRSTLVEGVHGLVKLTAEHSLSDGGQSAAYTVQGAGSLIVQGGGWYVVTARHVVVPDPSLRVVGDIEFEEVTTLGTRVVMSSLGLHPVSIRISSEQDIAILEVAVSDRGVLEGMVSLHPDAPIKATQGPVVLGATVQAWGYPAKQHPQVQTPAVSAKSPGFFVLNQALLRGYSGGPVLVERGGRFVMGGVISRADDEASQTTVLEWGLVDDVLEGRHVIKLEVPGETTYNGVHLEAR